MPARVLSIYVMVTKDLEFTGKSRSGAQWLSITMGGVPSMPTPIRRRKSKHVTVSRRRADQATPARRLQAMLPPSISPCSGFSDFLSAVSGIGAISLSFCSRIRSR